MTAPVYVATRPELAQFTPAPGLPVFTPTPQLVSDQPTLNAVLLAAGRSGVELVLTTSGTAAKPATFDPASTALVKIERARTRMDNDRRAKRPLYDGGTYTTVATVDGTLTNFVQCADASALSNTQSAILTQSELDASPFDFGHPGWQHQKYRLSSAAGAHFVGPSKVANAQGTPLVNPIGVQNVRVRSSAPKISFQVYAAAGVANTATMLYVDGQPTTARAVPAAGALTYPTVVHTDGKSHEYELKTSGLLFGTYTAPTYDLVRPPARSGPSIYSMCDSFGSSVWNDAGTAVIAQDDALPHRVEDHLGVAYNYVDTVGGTGWIATAASGFQGPNNNFEQRLPQAERVAAEWFYTPNGCVNDASQIALATAGYSAQLVVDAIRRCYLRMRAANPAVKFIYAEGYAPSGLPNASILTTVRTMMQTQLADIGVYYIKTATRLTGTGAVDAKNGTGNQDWMLGTDKVHPVYAGYEAMKADQIAALRRIFLDDGSLLNQLI